MNRLLPLAAAALVVVAGCSGADEPVDEPSGTVTTTTVAPRVFPAGTEDLCGAFADAQDAYADVGGLYGDAAEVPDAWVAALHAWADALDAAVLPEDLDRDQRDGVRLLAQQLRDVPVPATGSDVHRVEGGLTEGEALLVGSLVDYVDATCGLETPGL